MEASERLRKAGQGYGSLGKASAGSGRLGKAQECSRRLGETRGGSGDLGRLGAPWGSPGRPGRVREAWSGMPVELGKASEVWSSAIHTRFVLVLLRFVNDGFVFWCYLYDLAHMASNFVAI